MLEVIGSVEIEMGHPALAVSVSVSREVPIAAASTQVYVGPYFRFTALTGGRRGATSEVLGFDDVWRVHDTWEET